MPRRREEGDAFADLTYTDWQRASDVALAGDWGPFSIAADFHRGWLTVDEAHEMILAWLNRR